MVQLNEVEFPIGATLFQALRCIRHQLLLQQRAPSTPATDSQDSLRLRSNSNWEPIWIDNLCIIQKRP